MPHSDIGLESGDSTSNLNFFSSNQDILKIEAPFYSGGFLHLKCCIVYLFLHDQCCLLEQIHFFLENPVFSANFAKFDFTNTVIIMRKIGSDLPSPNISFIRPIFNYL